MNEKVKHKIVLIDDSRTAHAYLEQVFNNEFELVHVYDSKIAIDMIKETLPDLVLIDWEMPEVNGVELSSIMHFQEHINIPSIILTGNYNEANFIQAAEAGSSDLLSKSSSGIFLLSKIKTIIKQNSKIKEEITKKQLESVKALIATAAHEFNNAVFISNSFMSKAAKCEDPEERLRLLNKSIEANLRISSVIKKLKDIDHIDYEDHSSKVLMLKLG